MRFSKLAFISLLVSFIFVACGPFEPGPEVVAEKYLFYLNNKEFDKAKELCTEQSRKMIEKFEFFGNLNGGVETGRTLIENVKCFIDSDNAVCTFNADGKGSEMLLVKVDGKWLVDFDMEEEDLSESDDAATDTSNIDTLESTEDAVEEMKD